MRNKGVHPEDEEEGDERSASSSEQLRRRSKRRKLDKPDKATEGEEEAEEEQKERATNDNDDDEDERRHDDDEERGGEEKSAPGAINSKATSDDGNGHNNATKPIGQDENEKQKIKSDAHANFIRVAAKKRINYERELDKQQHQDTPNKPNTQRLDNIVFPPLSILIVDDYMLVNSSEVGNQDYQEDINTTFRRDVTATYKTLSNIYSSLSNHLSIHVIALGEMTLLPEEPVQKRGGKGGGEEMIRKE